MDEDQNSDILDGEVGHSVGISQSVVVVVAIAVEERQSLEQLKLNCHEEKVNCHE